jgi:hypothetical protein
MKTLPHVFLLSSCALAACAPDEQALETASLREALAVSQVAEKDLAIAFDLGDEALVRAADLLPTGEVLLPRELYRQVEQAFDGTSAEDALQDENLYTDWKVVSARVSPCSALGPVPAADVSALCWPEVRLVLQPILYNMRVHARFSPAFADDRAMHVLYDVPFEHALSAVDAARARELVSKVRAAAPSEAFAPLAAAERRELIALRDRATTRLLEDTLVLRDAGLPSQAYAGLGLRPESLEDRAARQRMRDRFRAFLGVYARPSRIRELTAFSLPAGREPAHLDQWVFVAFRGAPTELVPVDLTLTSARDGATLFNYGHAMVSTMGADDLRPQSALSGPRGAEIRDSVILSTQDIARLAGPISDRSERLVPNVPCGSCHKLNDLRFDFHNFGYLEDRDLTISPRVRRDVELDLAWLRETFVPSEAGDDEPEPPPPVLEPLSLVYTGPALSIPDNASAGRQLVLASTVSGKVTRLRVQVDIQHTYRGDLKVELTHAGRTLVLHNRAGGSADNLLLDLTTDAFAGTTAAGDFTLRVADLARGDVGTVRSFALSSQTE